MVVPPKALGICNSFLGLIETPLPTEAPIGNLTQKITPTTPTATATIDNLGLEVTTITTTTTTPLTPIKIPQHELCQVTYGPKTGYDVNWCRAYKLEINP